MALSLVLLSACATRPERIAASFVSHEKYSGQDCAQLQTDMSHAQAELQKFSSLQNTKADIDAASVLFVLVPASKISGDHAVEVAQWKGEVAALDTAMTQAACKKSKPV